MMYEAACRACAHEYDYSASMADRNKVPACPVCKSRKVHREFRNSAAVWMDKCFASENGGKGRFIDGLAKVSADGSSYDQKDPYAYCTSQKQALEKAKALGLTAEKA